MFDWQSQIEEYKDKGEGPFYTDYLYSVQEDYPTIGLASCKWGVVEGSDIPYLIPHKGVLIEKFNLHYYFRELGSETESRFQWSVDKVFDKIKYKYNHYFEMYENNEINELGRIIAESIDFTRNNTSTTNGEVNSENSEEETSKNKFQDMPIQEFIQNGNYATNITDGNMLNESEGKTTNNSKTMVSTVDKLDKEKHENDESVLEQVNKNLDIWRDLLMAFIDEFKTCFINELGRI